MVRVECPEDFLGGRARLSEAWLLVGRAELLGAPVWSTLYKTVFWALLERK